MKRLRKLQFLFLALILAFSCDIVFAENEIVIKSITPIYDEESSVVVKENEGKHSVVFNDKNQSVKYKVVIENTTKDEFLITGVDLGEPTADFLKYDFEMTNEDEFFKSKGTKELILSLETIEKEGWGRNFNEEITTTINFEKTVKNPNTGVNELIGIFGLIAIAATLIIFRKSKSVKYMALIIALGTSLPIVEVIDAEESITLSISLEAAFESQNVMEKAGAWSTTNAGEFVPVDYWQYADKIKNINIANEFSEIEEYAYRFDVSEKKNERVIAYLVVNETDANYYDLYIQADGIIYPNTFANCYFYKMTNLDKIENLEGFDTSNVIDMSFMFTEAGLNSPNFVLDLGDNFDTSNVFNMYGMFSMTGASNPNFTLDLGDKFDTSKVMVMDVMFRYTGANSSVFTLDLGDKFNTSNVTSMSNMFAYTGGLNPNFTLDLGDKFDTSKVTNMVYMFDHAGYNSSKFTLDLGDKFNTSNVTDMTAMFAQAGYNSPVFTLDLGDNFNTSKVTNMYYMFSQMGYKSKQLTLDLGDKFDTSNVTNMFSMFGYVGYNSPVFTLDLGDNFNTSKVTNMGYMFDRAGYKSNVFTLDLGDKFDTSNVTNMYGMFAATGYTNPNFTLDLGDKFDMSKVTNTSYMFNETGYNSTVLDVTITIRNPNVSYSRMFLGTATKSGSKVIVNYTSDTNRVAQWMVNTSSYYSNVNLGTLVE